MDKKIIILAILTCLAGIAIAAELNTDRPGSDFASFDLPVASPSICEQACNDAPDCEAWTYVKPGVQAANAKCWLKDSVPDAVPSTNCVSGVKTYTPAPAPAPALSLTGTWNCDDGGVYYIRQLGSTIWWFGERDPNNPTWSNVMHGTLSSGVINGDWADVPKGDVMQSGILVLQVESANHFYATSKTGGFAGSDWTRA